MCPLVGLISGAAGPPHASTARVDRGHRWVGDAQCGPWSSGCRSSMLTLVWGDCRRGWNTSGVQGPPAVHDACLPPAAVGSIQHSFFSLRCPVIVPTLVPLRAPENQPVGPAP